MDSILTSVKKLLGLHAEDDAFDQDIIMHINSVFGILTQLGVGASTGFRISDERALWSDFIGDDPRINMVKSYMGLKVRLLFDPPLSSAVAEAVNRQISELEWRLNAAVDPEEENQNG